MEKNEKILISFIIPIYNAELYLENCINSILSQDPEEIEIILVNDGSTDKSPTICDKYAKENSNIKTIHQKNQGVAGARNTGIKAGSGEYLFFIDNDDWIKEGAVNILKKSIKKTQADVILHRYSIENKNNIIVKKDINSKKINDKTQKEILNYLRKKRVSITAPWEYIVKKSLLEENEILFSISQNGVDDSHFTPVVFCSAKSFYFNKNVIYGWRQRQNSQSKNIRDKKFIEKMLSATKGLEEYSKKIKEDYKIKYILYRIYKNIYFLMGQYYRYPASSPERIMIKDWVRENEKLIKQSSRQSGLMHRILIFIFGNIIGIVLGYKLAVLKSKIYSIIYRK